MQWQIYCLYTPKPTCNPSESYSYRTVSTITTAMLFNRSMKHETPQSCALLWQSKFQNQCYYGIDWCVLPIKSALTFKDLVVAMIINGTTLCFFLLSNDYLSLLLRL
ncbi:hypothetical protein I3843_05G006900 [Carya illinoinensis]|uniref:Uncharacterized protein n=1 Tax=Carya illinoinensis TaxID=32201 RepID=A0A922JK32_CARIL|nr:hypothetical protein I3842_05G007200 [Carya illinoinensis]KAG7976974.1 hypothetical protein I3843_05G006900 [Carya illinoinensis]